MLALHRRTDCLLWRVFLLNVPVYVYVYLNPLLFAWGALGGAWTVWLAETHTYGSSHPDSLLSHSSSLSYPLSPSLSLLPPSLPLLPVKRVHSNQTKATCATLTPFHPHLAALCRSYVIHRLMPTYTRLIEHTRAREHPGDDPTQNIEEISETNYIRFPREVAACRSRGNAITNRWLSCIRLLVFKGCTGLRVHLVPSSRELRVEPWLAFFRR